MPRHSKTANHPTQTTFSDSHDILMNAPVGIFTSTPEGRFIFANQTLAELFGYGNPRELMNSVTDIATQIYADPADRDQFKTLMEEHNKVINHECLLLRRDGNVFWAFSNIQAVHDQDGNISHYRGFLTNIDKRKRTEEELKDKEQLLKLVTDNMFDLVALTDLEGNFEFVGKSHEIFGYDPDFLLGKNVMDFVHPDDFPRIILEFKEFLQLKDDGRKVEYRYRRKNNSYTWLETMGKLIKNDNSIPEKILFSSRDISDRKSAEGALAESEKKYRELFETAPVGIFQTTPDGRFISINSEYARIFGYESRKEMMSLINDITGELYVHSKDRERYKELLRKQVHVKDFETRLKRRDGDIFWVSMNTRVKHGPNNEIIYDGFLTDITERKRVEEKSREREVFIKSTLDNLPVGVAINSVDPKVHFSYMNDNFARFYRTTREELAPPNDFWEVVYQEPEFREKIKKKVLEDCAGNDPDLMYWKDVPVFRPGQEPFYITAKNIPVPGSNFMVSTVWDVTDRKLTEDRLRESEARFRSIYENTAVGLARVSLDFKIMSANKAYCSMLGYQENDLIGRHLREITHPDSLEQDIEKQSKLASGEIDHYRVEKKFIHKNGQTIYAILDVNTIRDASGENLYFLGSVLDITERKQAEEDLKKIEWMLTKKPYSDMSRQEKLHDQGYGDLTRLNRDGIILKHIGKEFLGNIAKDYLDLLGTSSAIYERNGDYAFGIFASGWCRMMDRASRDLCNTLDNAQALNSGKWLCHESCWTDCSKEAIARGASVDIECSGGIRLYAEPIFVGGEVMGVINFGYGDPPREPEKLRQLAKTYSLSYDALERESYAYDSRPKYIIELAKSRLRTSAQLIGSLVEVRMAQEERDKLQSQLLQAQKMESVGILAGGIAHDFNNLLHVMGGNLELLDMKLAEDHPGKKRIPTIQKSMGRAAQLVRQMLQFSRKAEAKRQDMDLNQGIQHAADMLERTIPKMVIIELDLDKEARFINADPIQVEQILLNLGNNSADAMPDGGRLIIETSNVDVDEALANEHTGLKKGEYVLLRVSDTGCGMDEETLDKVFDPFFTTKEVGKGTGLGLASAYGIVKAHEGYITCESKPGQGTIFKIYWPAVTAGPEGDQQDKP